MKRRSKNRETAALLAETWNKNAALDPFYSILSDDEKKGGRWKIDEFFKTGRDEVAELHSSLSKRGLRLGGARALDFGCGVGRLTQALAPYFREMVGVDVSNGMLDKARALNTHANVTYTVNIDPDLTVFPDDSFDFILSRLVLQHTSRALTASYLGEFGRILRRGGLIDVQVPVGFKNPWGLVGAILPSWTLERYQMRKRGVVLTTTYPIRSTSVTRIMAKKGCRLVDVTSVEANPILRIKSFLFTK